jgi:diketogulonate reductase-like aldo/keto reductase
MRDGQDIPQFGLGVYEMSDKETYDCVKHALEVGYRHIDTAEWYGNEEPCGRAIRDFISASTLQIPLHRMLHFRISQSGLGVVEPGC